MHIPKWLLLIGITSSPLVAKTKRGHPCLRPANPVCQNIVKLSPEINRDYALKISNAFSKVARKRKLPVKLLLAIAKQESNFRPKVVRNVRGLVQNERGEYQMKTVGSDFCMMQINASNIVKMKMDANRLINDPYYCIDAGARILKFFTGKKKSEPNNWWSRYNAVSKHHRETYEKFVGKHWRKIDPQGACS